MAKRQRARRGKAGKKGRKRAAPRSSASRAAKRAGRGSRKTARVKARLRVKARPRVKARARVKARPRPADARIRVKHSAKPHHLDRERRILVEDETVRTPPSSLNLDRHGSAARSGRAELAESLRKHGGITPGITGGDVDADFENAYFSGDEAPGGDNPTPDQEVVDDIGKALGVLYEDNEELRAGDKVIDRDKHRWELDPASSEDYKDRK